MSTIAMKGYVWKKRNKKAQNRIFLLERFCQYYRKNRAEIISSCMLMNGNAQAYDLYHSLKNREDNVQ